MIPLILLVIILGTLIFIHELGHFLMAKRAGVHIYEFALGFGPKIWSKVGKKDKVIYSLRMFPVGGFVQMAGEVYEDDTEIPKDKFMCNKPWIQRISVICAGVLFNFILAIILLFIVALGWGYTEQRSIVGTVVDGYPAKEAGIEEGDRILSVNGKTTKTWDMILLRVLMNKSDSHTFLVKKVDGKEVTYKISPKKEKNQEGQEVEVFGFTSSAKEYKGFANAIKYSLMRFSSIISSLFVTIGGLFSGKIALSNLAGPVGMYSIVDQTAKYGIQNIIALMALLSINLGFINILPFPAFDGGRALFLIIEKIIGRPINKKIENIMHTIFFILLMGLMLLITIQDIIKLF